MPTRPHTYPDQSLYLPTRCRRWSADQRTAARRPNAKIEGDTGGELAPINADGEAGFGGALNVYEPQKALIAAGVAGSHWEDQLAF